jgi:hypothetical protein
MTYKTGDVVKVRQDVLDPDFGDDISGWQGKIIEIDGDLVTIDLDEITLSKCPPKYIQQSEEDGLDWEKICLSTEEIEPAIPRIIPAKLRGIKYGLRLRHQWDYLGESVSKCIQEVLDQTKITDENAIIYAWEKYLDKNLVFPFDGVISHYQDRGPLQQGDLTKVHGLSGSDEHYGVLVNLRLGRKRYDFPLCDIRVEDKESGNFKLVDDYKVWFANK